MAVVIRLARYGTKKRPYYRVVAAEKTFRRDGRFLEVVGTYSPKSNPSVTTIKAERIQYWLSVGAKPSALVRSLIKKNMPGVVEQREDAQLRKLQAQRKKRKASVAGKAKKPAKKKTSKKE